MYFSTSYLLDGVAFNTFIWALDQAGAVELAKRRNINEVVIGQVVGRQRTRLLPTAAEHYSARQLSRCAHGITFYSWIAARAGTLDHDFVLSDFGILHEVIHELEYPALFTFRQIIYNKILELEETVPGLYKRGLHVT